VNAKYIAAALASAILLSSAAEAGRYAGDFLDIGVGGRALAMGGAFVSIADDPSGPYYNPAGIGRLRKREATLMHSWLYMGMATHDFVSFATPLGEGLGLALSGIRFGVDDIPIFPELGGTPDERRQDPQLRPDGTPEGYFADVEYAGCLTLAKEIVHEFGEDIEYIAVPVSLSVGGNLKYIYQSLMDNTGTGIGVDFGMTFGLKLSDMFARSYLGGLSAGFSVMDIGGTKITWDTASKRADEITPNYRYGASYVQNLASLRGVLTLSLEVASKYGQRVSFGGEYVLMDRVAVRAGYTGSDITLGAGVSGPYHSSVDYVFAGHSIDNTHRISLGVWF
jgi:hypothetical protein